MKSPRPANKTRQFSTSVHRKRKKSRQKATFFTILPVFCITKFQHFHPNIRFLRNIALQFQSNPPKQRCRAMQNAPIKACELWQSSAQQRRLFPHILHHPAQGASAIEKIHQKLLQRRLPRHRIRQGNPRQIGFLQLQKAVCPAWLQTL